MVKTSNNNMKRGEGTITEHNVLQTENISLRGERVLFAVITPCRGVYRTQVGGGGQIQNIF